VSDDGEPSLSPQDAETIKRCLTAAVDGPFFPEWEFHALFGLRREEVRVVLHAWPGPPQLVMDGYESGQHVQRVAVGNALNNLLGYPHGVDSPEFEEWTGSTKHEIAETLRRWRGEETFDPSGRGYFDRLL
jgi:hypothetical protein